MTALLDSDKLTSATAVYGKIRRDILTGEIAAGQKLLIDKMAQRYECGTNPVREALNRLSAERLVDRREQRGFYVPPLSLESLRELVRTRCWLEGRALEESIANRTPAWEEGIIVTHYRLARTPIHLAEDGGDNREWEGHHRAFHDALIANCGSTWLLAFCHEMMDQAVRYRFASMSTCYPRRDAEGEHTAIMEAALDGDAPNAVRLLSEQYMLTLARLEEHAWS
ncbi:GntR family transcriptional regulator [Aureimonas frigidaquae]|uniref:GntR family transcriptional regulator n=1 Tax=Aureimonas frigidaquae TaxID=424757 RepID=UPI00078022D3|nr:GntR family transcriptional regulator [Aureimonas frigidaquae]